MSIMSIKSIVLWTLLFFFVYFILFYMLSKTIHIEGYNQQFMPVQKTTANRDTENGDKTPIRHMEVSIDALNTEVNKLNGKLDGFDKRITYLVGQTNGAMDRAKRAQDSAAAADDKITNLTKAMAP